MGRASSIKFYTEDNNTLELTVDYPKDTDPSKVKLKLPYTNGRLLTEEDIENLGGGGGVSKEYVDGLIGELDSVNLDMLGIDPNISLPNPAYDYSASELINIIIEKLVEIRNGVNNSNSYTNPKRVPINVGGVSVGTTFDNVSYTDVFNKLFYPYQNPSISSFTTANKVNYKLGEPTSNVINVSWNTNNKENIKDGSVKFIFNGVDITNGVVYPKQGNASLNITPVTKTNQQAVTLVMEITDINNKKYNKTITFTWLNCIYYGNRTTTSITGNDAKSMNKLDANSANRDYNYPGGGYKYLCIPRNWSIPNKFVDPSTNFDVPMENIGVISITNNFNVAQEYNVFKSTNVLNGAITIRVK